MAPYSLITSEIGKLAQFDKLAKHNSKNEVCKKTSTFVKKLTFDLDEEHLAIIERRQKMKGILLGIRGVSGKILNSWPRNTL